VNGSDRLKLLKLMKIARYPDRQLGFVLGSVLLAALTGCTTYVEERPAAVYAAPEPAPVYVAPAPAPVIVETPAAPPVVAIETEADFYQPLTPYGRWVDTPDYGRVWVPGGVAADWRPYSNGHWEQTEAGWFWVSDEPWAWATYHYGRWNLAPNLGWCWVPQTQWAPAWVAWRRGGGYTGWAPLPPAPRNARGIRMEVDVNAIAPRSFVFVEERRFSEPLRPATVIVNNTEIVNKTVIFNTTTIVNKTVINAGPPAADIEKAAGRPVPKVAVKDLRSTAESHVAAPRAVAPRAAAPPAAAPPRPASPPAAVQRPAAPKAAENRPALAPANLKPAVTETNRPKPASAGPVRAGAPQPAPAKPAQVRPSPPTSAPKPAVTETSRPKPPSAGPVRVGAPQTTPAKPPQARPASPPAKPATPEKPEKPESKDENKKPGQP